MTLHRLKLLAILAPLLFLGALELARQVISPALFQGWLVSFSDYEKIGTSAADRQRVRLSEPGSDSGASRSDFETRCTTLAFHHLGAPAGRRRSRLRDPTGAQRRPAFDTQERSAACLFRRHITRP